jgi:hypothetical protein
MGIVGGLSAEMMKRPCGTVREAVQGEDSRVEGWIERPDTPVILSRHPGRGGRFVPAMCRFVNFSSPVACKLGGGEANLRRN